MSKRQENDAEKMIGAARKRNRMRDAIERENGFAAPGDCPPDVFMATVFMALEAGISMGNWECVAEAAAMLDDKVKELKGPDGRGAKLCL